MVTIVVVDDEDENLFQIAGRPRAGNDMVGSSSDVVGAVSTDFIGQIRVIQRFQEANDSMRKKVYFPRFVLSLEQRSWRAKRDWLPTRIASRDPRTTLLSHRSVTRVRRVELADD